MNEQKYYCITYAWRKTPRNEYKEVKPSSAWDFDIDLVSVHPFEWYGMIQKQKKELSQLYTWEFKLITWNEISENEYNLGKRVGLV